jgi:hypothetical protein
MSRSLASLHGLLEDGGVRRQSCDAVVLDEALELALGDEAPLHEVEPDALARFPECLDAIHGVSRIRAARCASPSKPRR